jgi:hypothetical protein
VAAYDVARFRRAGAPAAVVPDVLVFRLSLHLDPGAGVQQQTVRALRTVAERAVAEVSGWFLLPGHAQFELLVEFTADPQDAVWRVEVRSGSDAASGSEPDVWPATLAEAAGDEAAGRVRAELLARLLRMLGGSRVDPDELAGGEIPPSCLLRIWALQELHEVPLNFYPVADPPEDTPLPPAQADTWWEGAMAAVMLRRWLRVTPGERKVRMLDDEHFRGDVATAVRQFMEWDQLRLYNKSAYTLVPTKAVYGFAQALTVPRRAGWACRRRAGWA